MTRPQVTISGGPVRTASRTRSSAPLRLTRRRSLKNWPKAGNGLDGYAPVPNTLLTSVKFARLNRLNTSKIASRRARPANRQDLIDAHVDCRLRRQRPAVARIDVDGSAGLVRARSGPGIVPPSPSPLRSAPAMMLYGRPDATVTIARNVHGVRRNVQCRSAPDGAADPAGKARVRCRDRSRSAARRVRWITPRAVVLR